MSGTHQGNYQGIPPTGKRVQIIGISFYRMANGKLAEAWVSSYDLIIRRQLVAIPEHVREGLTRQ